MFCLMMDHELLWWCLYKTRWWTWSKKIWPLTTAAPWWRLTFLTQNETMNRKEKHYVNLPPPHHNDDQFYLHKMRSIIEGKKLWALAIVSLLHHNDDQFCLHKWDHEQEGKKWWALATTWPLHHDNDGLCLMFTQNENMNKRGKKYGHLLPSHHGHDWWYLITNAYTKLNHEHDQETF